MKGLDINIIDAPVGLIQSIGDMPSDKKRKGNSGYIYENKENG